MRSGTHIGLRVVTGYVAVTVAGATALAALPTTDDGGLPVPEAVFTAASAVTLTGLTSTPTAALTGLGQAVVFALIAIGAIGVAAATAGIVVLRGRGGWRARQSVAADVSVTGTEQRAFLRYVIAAVAGATVAGGLALRWSGFGWWESWFHALSGFANAGFSTRPDSLASAPVAGVWVLVGLVIVGGLGYPVTYEILRRRRYRSTAPASATTTLALKMTGWLLLASLVWFALAEWTRPQTLGAVPAGRRAAALAAMAVMPRSAGFNVTETEALSGSSSLVTNVLMYIGAGPAATAGGIKVTGFAVLCIVLVAACKGRTSAHAGRFGIDARLVNHVVAVAMVLLGAIIVVALVLARRVDTAAALFDATSAVTTTGLSTAGPPRGPVEHLVLSVGMLTGRLAPMLLAVRLLDPRSDATRPANRPVLVT